MSGPFKMKGWSPFAQKQSKGFKTGKKVEGFIGLKPSEETDAMSFDEAFRNARDKGVQEFIWKGKKYHTKTKEEV